MLHQLAWTQLVSAGARTETAMSALVRIAAIFKCTSVTQVCVCGVWCLQNPTLSDLIGGICSVTLGELP